MKIITEITQDGGLITIEAKGEDIEKATEGEQMTGQLIMRAIEGTMEYVRMASSELAKSVATQPGNTKPC